MGKILEEIKMKVSYRLSSLVSTYLEETKLVFSSDSYTFLIDEALFTILKIHNLIRWASIDE